SHSRPSAWSPAPPKRRRTPSVSGISAPWRPLRTTVRLRTSARVWPPCWGWITTTSSAAATRSRGRVLSPIPLCTLSAAWPTRTSLRLPATRTASRNAWRIRGPSNSPGAPQGNGWALQAPQYTQGAQFSSSTAGYTNVSFHFDWYTTTQGVKNLQEQYTLNGTTWININSPLTAVSDGWLAPQTINFSGIAGASNDPNFGVRLVSVYDNSLPFPNYGSADGGQGGYYNNNSGNWRFADVGFTGTAVPEPSSYILSIVALAGLIVWRRWGR